MNTLTYVEFLSGLVEQAQIPVQHAQREVTVSSLVMQDTAAVGAHHEGLPGQLERLRELLPFHHDVAQGAICERRHETGSVNFNKVRSTTIGVRRTYIGRPVPRDTPRRFGGFGGPRWIACPAPSVTRWTS